MSKEKGDYFFMDVCGFSIQASFVTMFKDYVVTEVFRAMVLSSLSSSR